MGSVKNQFRNFEEVCRYGSEVSLSVAELAKDEIQDLFDKFEKMIKEELQIRRLSYDEVDFLFHEFRKQNKIYFYK